MRLTFIQHSRTANTTARLEEAIPQKATDHAGVTTGIGQVKAMDSGDRIDERHVDARGGADVIGIDPTRFEIRGSFDPTRSLLGRRLAKNRDRLRAEALYYFVAVMIVIGLLAAGFLGWAAAKAAVLARPIGGTAIIFWTIQLTALATFGGLCLVGYRPTVSLSITSRHLNIRQGDEGASLRLTDIASAEIVPAVTYHRHYRRYSAVKPYVGRRSDQYVIVRAGTRLLAIGIEGDDARRFVAALNAARIPVDSDPKTPL